MQAMSPLLHHCCIAAIAASLSGGCVPFTERGYELGELCVFV